MRVPRRGSAGVAFLFALALLSISALGCGLLDRFGQEAEPTPEPDIGATVTAAIAHAAATREAASQTEPQALHPTPAAIPTETPLPTPPAETSGPQDPAETLSTVGSDTTWGYLFDSLTEAERSCIAAELGEERLAQAMGTPVFGSDPARAGNPLFSAVWNRKRPPRFSSSCSPPRWGRRRN